MTVTCTPPDLRQPYRKRHLWRAPCTYSTAPQRHHGFLIFLEPVAHSSQHVRALSSMLARGISFRYFALHSTMRQSTATGELRPDVGATLVLYSPKQSTDVLSSFPASGLVTFLRADAPEHGRTLPPQAAGGRQSLRCSKRPTRPVPWRQRLRSGAQLRNTHPVMQFGGRGSYSSSITQACCA